MNYTKEQLLNVRFHTRANNPLIFTDGGGDTINIYHIDNVGSDKFANWEMRGINSYLKDGSWTLDSPINHTKVKPSQINQNQAQLIIGFQAGVVITDDIEDGKEDSGGSCDYYKVDIMNPTTPSNNEGEHMDDATYTAECNDIIEALDMTYAEANMFKEIWRTAAARTLGKQKAGHTTERGAEKIVFFAHRHAVQHGVAND